MIFNMGGGSGKPDITKGATATPETIFKGLTAGVNGELITGVYESPTSLIELSNFDSKGYARKVIFNVPDKYGDIGTYLFSVDSGFKTAPDHIVYADEVIINSKNIASQMFYYTFRSFGGKLKVFAKNIEYGAFEWFGTYDGSPTVQKKKIWFSKDILTIESTAHSGQTLFGDCTNNFHIYCEPTSKPSGWGKYWNYYSDSSQITTHWGVSEEEFNAL